MGTPRAARRRLSSGGASALSPLVALLLVAAVTVASASASQAPQAQRGQPLGHLQGQRVDVRGALLEALRERTRDATPCARGGGGLGPCPLSSARALRGGRGEEGGEGEDGGEGDKGGGRGRSEKVQDHVFVSGLPPYASEEWVCVLLGRNRVAFDDASGARKVYVYRDARGACSGSAVVGMVSEEEAAAAERECSGRLLQGLGTTLEVRVIGKRRAKDSALPDGWHKFVDERSGEAYYYDSLTGKTQWMIPEAPRRGGEIVDDRTVRQRDGRKIAGADWYGAGGGELKEKAGPAIPGVERGEDESSEERRREEADIERRRRCMPRGCKEDILLVDRKAHEAAAVHAPEYGDPGFIHCIGPCQCRCRGTCVGLCTCKKCECYPGTPWPMHPEIFRLRQLGIPRTLEHYNSLKPPPGYIAGVGRGAVGFTTQQDIGQSMEEYRRAQREYGALKGRGRGRGRGRAGGGGGAGGRPRPGQGLGGVWGPSALDEWRDSKELREVQEEEAGRGQFDDAEEWWNEGVGGDHVEDDGLLDGDEGL